MKLNVKALSSALCLGLAIVSLSACEGDDGTTAGTVVTTPTDGSQSKAELAGFGYSCAVLTGAAGSAISGKQLVRYISLNAAGTYDFAANVVDGTSCLFGHSTGGTGVSYSQYNVSGTWTVGGTNALPTTAATKITLTPTSQTLTIYNPQSVTVAMSMVSWANACTGWVGTGGGGSGFSTTASATRANFSPSGCATGGAIDMGVPPTLGAVQYNTANRATNLQTGTVINMYSPNAGTYPTSYSLTWQ